MGPEDLTLIAGDSARFPCEVNGAPRPDVQWYRGKSSAEGLAKKVIICLLVVRFASSILCLASGFDSGFSCHASKK